MNKIAKDILMSLGMSGRKLEHYGTKRHSGRYPYGSGDIPFQHEDWFTWGKNDFLNQVEAYKAKGMGKTEIAKEMGYSTTEFRKIYGQGIADERMKKIACLKKMYEAGYSKQDCEQLTGISESTQRSLMDPLREARSNAARATATFLKEQVDTKGVIDIGKGVNYELGISEAKFDQAVKLLEEMGYEVKMGRIDKSTEPGGKQKTLSRVLCPPGSPKNAAYDISNIHTIKDYMIQQDENGNDIVHPAFAYPASCDSSRISVVYSSDKDGLIELRPGVKDLSLGDSRYSQVRILVDGTHFIKGMAVYSNDLPEGVDIRVNSHKKEGTPLKGPDSEFSVLKPIKKDPDNPFGALIKEKGGQSYWYDDNGNEHLSLINKKSDEGDWQEWADRLPSQFLSKQKPKLVKQQLNLAIASRQDEYDEIMSLENPTIKRELLKSFAEDCDKQSVALYAAALPGQKYHTIIPANSLKDDEIYAPRYSNGTKLALVRFPHQGTYEIPIVKVNNKNTEGKSLISPTSIDAVCINQNVAQRLSGADFDGDTVMAIPLSDKVDILSTRPLKGLKGFDPQYQYAWHDGMTEKDIMHNTDIQMGVISNLITDMTLMGAQDDELARATRHAQVVIDAEKHKLDYKQSYIDNGIAELHKKYQGYTDANGKYHSRGAGTLLSRSKSPYDRPQTVGQPKVDPETGKLIYKYSGRTFIDKKGTERPVYEEITKMEAVDNAHDLLSKDRPAVEIAYADYANKLKAMANEARKTATYGIKDIQRDPEMAVKYKEEVNSLMYKLKMSVLNAPREREAQRLANVKAKEKEDIFREQTGQKMSKKDRGKMRQQLTKRYRDEVGAHRVTIDITEKEWEAIQKGAVSKTVLMDIMQHANMDILRQYAMPRTQRELSDGKKSRIKAMEASGYSLAEIAEACGVSTSTVSRYLKGDA